jgi:hypothetical protein
MTTKVFWTDPYLTKLETRIAEVRGDEIMLERTILYALSGGQESDAGTIGGHPVLEARKQGKDILYRLGPGHGLGVGDLVLVLIDWERRYRLMRLHFAAEIVLELVYRKLDEFLRSAPISLKIKRELTSLGQAISPQCYLSCNAPRRRSLMPIRRSLAHTATRRPSAAIGRCRTSRAYRVGARICAEQVKSGRST